MTLEWNATHTFAKTCVSHAEGSCTHGSGRESSIKPVHVILWPIRKRLGWTIHLLNHFESDGWSTATIPGGDRVSARQVATMREKQLIRHVGNLNSKLNTTHLISM
jgi:hypothetical protein